MNKRFIMVLLFNVYTCTHGMILENISASSTMYQGDKRYVFAVSMDGDQKYKSATIAQSYFISPIFDAVLIERVPENDLITFVIGREGNCSKIVIIKNNITAALEGSQNNPDFLLHENALLLQLELPAACTVKDAYVVCRESDEQAVRQLRHTSRTYFDLIRGYAPTACLVNIKLHFFIAPAK
jgi:hypothetical protein